MNGSQEGCSIFSITGCNTAPSLKVQKRIFYQMSMFVEMFVIMPLFFAVFLWWYHRLHTLSYCLLYYDITIIPLISQKHIRCQTFNQKTCLCTICSCTFCNNSPERHTMRIHGQMQLCVEPPFVRVMS